MKGFFVQSYEDRRHIFVSFSGWRLRVSCLAAFPFHDMDRSCPMKYGTQCQMHHLNYGHIMNSAGPLTCEYLSWHSRKTSSFFASFKHLTRRSIILFTLTVINRVIIHFVYPPSPSKFCLTIVFNFPCVVLKLKTLDTYANFCRDKYKSVSWHPLLIMSHMKIVNEKKISQNLQGKKVSFSAERNAFTLAHQHVVQWRLLSASNLTKEDTQRGFNSPGFLVLFCVLLCEWRGFKVHFHWRVFGYAR